LVRHALAIRGSPRERDAIRFGPLLLRHPAAGTVVILLALAIMLDGLADLPPDRSLGSWTGYVSAGFFVYAIVIVWFAPALSRRAFAKRRRARPNPSESPESLTIVLSVAAGLTPTISGATGWNFGASKGFLWAGAVLSAALIVFAMVRAAAGRRPPATTNEA
jgi:hypothetical protein